MAIKDLYPSVHPTLDLNFARTRAVDPRITFSRASTATYFDEFGVMRTVPANSPRIDFDPVTGECKGLLLEEQRTNLLTYSEQFDNAAWSKRGTTSITSNSTTAPDGTMTADLISGIYAGSSGDVYRTITTTASISLSASIYIKRVSTSGTLRLENSNTRSEGQYNINLSMLGNDWERITSAHPAVTVIAPFSSNSSGATGFMLMNNDATSISVYAWGAQLEAGTFPTSYIKTEASQVTRTADSAVMTGSNFSSWYRQDEGTFLAAYSRNSDKANGNQIPYVVSDGTGNNIITIADSANGTSDHVLITTNEAVQVNTGSINYTAGQLIIRSVGYKLNDVATSSNGAAVVTDDSALIPAVNQLSIGFAPYFSSSRLNGHIRRFAYYPKRLSNTNLRALTT